MRKVLLLMLLLVGCDNPFGPDVPDGAIPMEAMEPYYSTWWSEVEDDSDLAADMSRIRWFYVPGGAWPGEGGSLTRGQWVSDHRIYLAEDYRGDRQVVKHEMLHDILGRSGHDHPLFQTNEYKRSPFR